MVDMAAYSLHKTKVLLQIKGIIKLIWKMK